MLVQVIHHPKLGKLGFAEPKKEGNSLLKFELQGFSSNRKTCHLYNIMHCSDYYKVNYLVRYQLQEPYTQEDKIVTTFLSSKVDLNRLSWKNLKPTNSTVFVPPCEQEILAMALDCLLWSWLD